MFRPLHSRTVGKPPRSRGAGPWPTGIALGMLLAIADVAFAVPFESVAPSMNGTVVPGLGTTSVVVGESTDAEGIVASDDGGGWTVTDGAEPAYVSAGEEVCPPGIRQRGACPPWNGVPGIVNRVLGDACPRVVFSADALMLWQGNVSSRPLFFDPFNGDTVLDVDQIDAPVAIGPRLDLILNIDQCHGIEANWFQVEPFGGTAERFGGPYAQDNLAGQNNADITSFGEGPAVAVDTGAVFKSFELNYRRRTCTPFTWLAGFRWVEWNESLDIVDTFSSDPPPDPPVREVDATSVTTGNNLYGGQIGVDALLWNNGGWVVFNGVAKAGVFGNYQAVQRTELRGDREFGFFADTIDSTAFVGEVGVNGTLRICRWLYWRAGYNFFWLSGVAVPAAQLSVTNQPTEPSTTVDVGGSVLLYGVNTGLEARW